MEKSLFFQKENIEIKKITSFEAISDLAENFPDKFKFVGSEADAYRQIGNAIPPVLIWHVAKALIEQIEKNKEFKNF